MRQGTTVNKTTSSFQSECFVPSVIKQEFSLSQKNIWNTCFSHIALFIRTDKNKPHKLRIKITSVYYGYAKFLCLESRFEVGKETPLCDPVLYMNLLKLHWIETWTYILLVLRSHFF